MTIETNFFKNPNSIKDFAAGETIIEEGQSGDCLYGIHEGEVEVIYQGQIVSSVGVGGVVGEMALIDNQPRSASAVAKTDCKLVPIDRHRFTFFVHEHPTFALFVMQTLADRLRKTMGIDHTTD